MLRDARGNDYVMVTPWLRVTRICEAGGDSVRINTVNSENRVYVGPQLDVEHVPALIEALEELAR
jgi:hypothetical protein